MADLAAADLTYTELSSHMGESSRVKRRFAITTAAGEYPTGGLPLTKAKLGCPNVIESLVIIESYASDPVLSYKYDRSAEKLKVIEDDGTSGVPAEHANATFTSPDQLIVEVSGY